MKKLFRSLAALLLLSTLNYPISTACAQGTAFTYQGRLNDANGLANGSYDFSFTLYNAATGGSGVGTFVVQAAVPVSNGLFTVTLNTNNEFGAGAFAGADRWLEIGVRINTNTFINYTTLTPRQPLKPTPYAIFANTASNLSGTLTSSQLPSAVVTNGASGVNITGSFTGNGANVTNVNAVSLGGIAASNYWRLTGNSVATNQFLGSTNNVNLELRANNEPAMRFSYRSNTNYGVSPAVIGGYKGNSASLNLFGNTDYVGATIGGGGYSNAANFVFADLGTVAGGAANIAGGVGSFVGGGTNNLASGKYSAVLGGTGNKATNDYSTAMGYFTTASAEASTAMGSGTAASGYSSIALGYSTTASGYSSTALGYQTTASGGYSSAMGAYARALHSGSFVWADADNSFAGVFDSVTNDTFNVRARNGVWFDDTAGSTTDLNFGAKARQMINLFNQQYGIGVQSSTTYFRSNSRFSWFRLGSHSDTQNDPGVGGSVLMTLTSSGLTVNGTFVSASDRNMKEDFKPVDAQAVLEKVVALPLSEWQYKSDEERSRHLGPMAQDFKSAFNLGEDDKHIAMVDADGVALAAIQGLNQKLDRENAELKQQLAELKALVQTLVETK